MWLEGGTLPQLVGRPALGVALRGALAAVTGAAPTSVTILSATDLASGAALSNSAPAVAAMNSAARRAQGGGGGGGGVVGIAFAVTFALPPSDASAAAAAYISRLSAAMAQQDIAPSPTTPLGALMQAWQTGLALAAAPSMRVLAWSAPPPPPPPPAARTPAYIPAFIGAVTAALLSVLAYFKWRRFRHFVWFVAVCVLRALRARFSGSGGGENLDTPQVFWLLWTLSNAKATQATAAATPSEVKLLGDFDVVLRLFVRWRTQHTHPAYDDVLMCVLTVVGARLHSFLLIAQ